MTLVVAQSPTPILQFFGNDGTFLVGGQLFTTVGGIPYPTYADPLGLIQHANPIILNSRGEIATSSGQSAQLYLIPNVTYTFALFDAQSNPIDTPTNIQGIPTLTTIFQSLTQAVLGGILTPQTQAEIAANVMPSNLAYPPLYVDRYGTNTTPGTTDTTAAWNAAVQVAKTSGGKVRYGATWPYLVTAPIDCTIAAGAGQYGFSIECEGNIVAITNAAPSYPSIIAKHTGHVFDCAGANGINFINVSVGTTTSVSPQTCFFMARNSGGVGSTHRFLNCRVLGYFSAALWYNYASESGMVEGCFFENQSLAAGTTTMEYTGTNVRNLSSTFITIATGQQSCIDHQVLGGQFCNFNTDPTSDVFRFESSDSIKIFGPWVDGFGRALVYVDITTTSKPVGHCRIFGLQGENGGGNKYGIQISNPASAQDLVIDWTVDSCHLPNTTAAIVAGANAIIDGWCIRNIDDQTTGSILFPGTVKYSSLDLTGANLLTIGVSQYNQIHGQSQNFTITTRTGDAIFDSSSVSTWVPNLSGLSSVTGSPAVIARIAYHGRMVSVSLQISGQTTLSATAGQQITGLPALATPAGIAFALVQLWDATSNVPLGAGQVTGTGISLPAFSAGTHTTVISASYMAS